MATELVVKKTITYEHFKITYRGGITYPTSMLFKTIPYAN